MVIVMESYSSSRSSKRNDNTGYDFYAKLWVEQARIDSRNRDKNLEKKINGTRIEFELMPRDWHSKLKEISLFYLGTDDQKFKDACSEYIKGILIHKECNSVVREDKDSRGKYFCGRCRKGNLELGADIRRIGVNEHLLADRIYSGELFRLVSEPSHDLSYLPPYSFFVSIEFTLRKPFISRDDDEFYVYDNSISKEKVFKVPYVRASSWKGNLRWAAYKKLIDKLHSMSQEEKIGEKSALVHERLALARIFGNEKDIMDLHLKRLLGSLNEEYEKELQETYEKKGGEEVSFQGRLQFYPTFFNTIGLDVINPHDRKTRAGTVPITLEVVPENVEGAFSLLYVPFDMIENKTVLKTQVSEDLMTICRAIRDMLMVHGFSAKKTSGYGVISTKLKVGFLDVRRVELENHEFESFDELIAIIEDITQLQGELDGKE
jgi:CRISPR/Cas system CMR subunit Cmr6 (Cas7 group RAMP superfamily)